ncbi:unnamed protein product [Sphagnum troendelagicum]|uniref:Uncharacterized protein n=1 Tax=Sphagnum troendelagicum TaxID=128251 RepID=A0ABP0TJ79_9BRYO
MTSRSREDDDPSWICEVGSEWMTRRRTPGVAAAAAAADDDDEERGISELGLQWMSTRPSLRKTNGCRSASETRKRFQGGNLDQGQRWASRTDHPQPNLKHRAWKDGEVEHGNGISELGSAWTMRRTHHSNGNGSSAESVAELGSELLQRKRTYVEEELDDDSWVADVGYRWVDRQRNSKNHKWSQSQTCRRSEVQKSAWVCELGSQWMSRRKEGGEEALNGRTLLSDPSSLLHMSGKRRKDDDDWISHVGADWMRGKKSTRDQCIALLDPQWDDTRRKLQFATPRRGCTRFETGEYRHVTGLETGEFGHVEGSEFFHAPERSGSGSLGGQEPDVEGLGSSFGEFKRPAMFSPFDSGSNSYC